MAELTSRVNDLILHAIGVWKTYPLPLTDLAHRCGLNIKSLQLWREGTWDRLNLESVGRLCWLFGVQPGEVVVWEGQRRRGRESPPSVRSSRPPPLPAEAVVIGVVAGTELPPATGCRIVVCNHIPALIGNDTPAQFARKTGLAPDRHRLLRVGTQWIPRQDLVAICTSFRVGMDDLLTVSWEETCDAPASNTP